MIRDAAALKLARDILDAGVSETHVQLVATLIQRHVEADELQQQIEEVEAMTAAVARDSFKVIDGGAA